MIKPFATALVLTATSSIASADVAVQFIEGAPKDRFVFSSSCAFTDESLTIDMANSEAGLIFDTTPDGAGVEVFQPLEIVNGMNALKDVPKVKDGDTAVTLNVKTLAADDTIAFTIDVDDTLKTSDRGQIIVTGSEIEGALLRFGSKEAAFDQKGHALIKAGCAT